MQVSKAFQEACGFRLSDETLNIAGGGELGIAKEILIKDIGMAEGVMPELKGRVRVGWECILEDLFGRNGDFSRCFFFSLTLIFSLPTKRLGALDSIPSFVFSSSA